MILNFLPDKYLLALTDCNMDKLYEIRLRLNNFVILNYDGNRCYLNANGVSLSSKNSFICSKEDIEFIIKTVTEHSIYAFNDRIRNGFLTTENSVRIGICGECVIKNGQVETIKNFSSLNIRIPHNIKNCSSIVFDEVVCNNNIYNSLIISPPAYGKTTILKDLTLKLNGLNKSILIIDERGEFSNVNGENIDVIRYCDKLFAFEYALRSMSPQIVITDELCDESDWKCVKNAVNSGVKIIASCHGKSLRDIKNKQYFIDNVFDKYFILESENKVGVLKEIIYTDYIKQ